MKIISTTDKIEVLNNGLIQVRELKQLVGDDNKVISDLKPHRYCLEPDIEIETITCPKVKSIAQATWTPEVIEEYKNSLLTGTEL